MCGQHVVKCGAASCAHGTSRCVIERGSTTHACTSFRPRLDWCWLVSLAHDVVVHVDLHSRRIARGRLPLDHYSELARRFLHIVGPGELDLGDASTCHPEVRPCAHCTRADTSCEIAVGVVENMPAAAAPRQGGKGRVLFPGSTALVMRFDHRARVLRSY
mmetsp:Transcript_144663/g.463519  ORF Transcript_144663/g.463519 Transcript_144663/m.463519 type:complete len:160 (+) Transcript_144663:701-1180(+)